MMVGSQSRRLRTGGALASSGFIAVVTIVVSPAYFPLDFIKKNNENKCHKTSVRIVETPHTLIVKLVT
jgi:hypothetical protein